MNLLTDAFATVASSLDTTAATLATLHTSLETVATRALAEQERVQGLLAGLPTVPESIDNIPLADNLGLRQSLTDLRIARQQLADHAGQLERLAIEATIQADQIHASRKELLASGQPENTNPQAIPVQPSQTAQEQATSQTAPEPTPEPIACQNTPQEAERASVLATDDSGHEHHVAAIAALPASEPIPAPIATSTPSEGEQEARPSQAPRARRSPRRKTK
jgi:hypothetical protein